MNYLTDYTDYPAYTDLPPDYTPYTPDVTETTGSTETFAGAPVTPAPTMPSSTYSMDMPPPSIESVLATAIPASFLSEMSNPSAVSSVVSEIQHGNFPTWYQQLPGSVKSWLMEHYATGSMPTATDGVSGSAAQGHNAAPPSGLAATSLLGAACILAAALIL
ncbi:uncharacterized protein N7483_003494 [Penicillium malachiteum]|uniref:uncharacterized protein n=1 Tax=Penicillium malachiteum TaxID=1324776 RepID=UPI002549A70C|nr:uncharacterized protein N7483_003494 [Penicillium malachiteum]KAJ5728986.1 hypothetical protein N7483_003494 [Penicillium malachiteum]